MAAEADSGVPTSASATVLSVLAERLIAVHTALDAAGLPHAFGGAIALAYCTQEPRGTRDLDVNVFVQVDRSDEVLAALPQGVRVTRAHRDRARRDGQVRLMWAETPVDVFLDTHDFHREVARGVRSVPFETTAIPVLGCEALVSFKAMYNRTKDWADIEAVLAAGAVDSRQVLDDLRAFLGPGDPAVIRLSALSGETA